ncbi:MAG: ABC transporter ATP-binding protein [Acidobacteriaceae bacterium]|nr:ABC transporter ATP-binding protein [Acidobacteriaceae bacterium]
MTAPPRIARCAWPLDRLGEALSALAHRSKLANCAAEIANPDHRAFDPGEWIDWAAKQLGCEAEPLQTTLGDIDSDLEGAYPAILEAADSAFLALLDGDNKHVRLLSRAGECVRVRVTQLCDVIRDSAECGERAELETLLDQTHISSRHRCRTLQMLLSEQYRKKRFNRCWVLRLQPGARPSQSLTEVGAIRNGAVLIGAHALQYVLWLLSWAILGTLSFSGRMDRGWLVAWALLLACVVPCQVITTWYQGLFAIGVGAFLKRRLLHGALQLDPEEMRHWGIGSFLGQALEAEAVETLALSGGIAGLLAIVELVISAFVLGRFSLLLVIWSVLAVALGLWFLCSYQKWTDTRMGLTQDLVESMVGHRTRLAQLPRDQWHEHEDQQIQNYIGTSKNVDKAGAWLIAALPRGWLIIALACLAPSIISAHTGDSAIAVTLGGILLAYTAFRRLTGSFADVAAAIIAAKRIGPLFQAASRQKSLGDRIALNSRNESTQKLLDADRLCFRYRKQGNPALQSCSLTIHKGDRILLEGPSGGGKTTFASLLSGLRQPESGLLLLNGLDRHTVGERRWREHVAAAPQFHENHILTETLAFNLLMGRTWPPTIADMEQAESVCRELGLGNLLDTMPSGLLQMVGEGGWQLSHGEQSRVFIARALLQNADLVILDESFAALDPENLRLAMECALRRAKTLMVIAHP